MSLTQIKHRAQFKQVMSFDGLEFEHNASPMDIDGVIEWEDRKIIFIEVKKKGTRVPIGERMTLQRIVNDIGESGKQAVAIVADHTVFDTEKDVRVADCVVRELYTSNERQWRPPKRTMTVDYFTRLFLYYQPKA